MDTESGTGIPIIPPAAGTISVRGRLASTAPVRLPMPQPAGAAAIMAGLERHPLRRDLLADTHRIGLPVPVCREGTLFLTAFVYASPSTYGQPRPIYRPHARIAVQAEDGRPVAYIEETFAPAFAAIPALPVPGDRIGETALSAQSLQDRDDLYARFYALLDETVASYAARDPIPGGVPELRALYDSLTAEPLRPYSVLLNPKFFAFLETGNHASADTPAVP